MRRLADAWVQRVTMTYAERISGHLGRRLVAGCAARPPGTTMTVGLGAGLGAAAGAIVTGASLAAGAGAALGVLLGYVVVALRGGRKGLPLSMALALDEDRLEVLRLGMLGSKPSGSVRTIPYTQITAVEADQRLLELRLRVAAGGDDLVVDTGRRGIGAGPPAVEELRRRVASDHGKGRAGDAVSDRQGTGS